MGRSPSFDWAIIAERLTTDRWYLLGKQIPYSVAGAILQGHIAALRNVKVKTRATGVDHGKRVCDIYLQRRE